MKFEVVFILTLTFVVFTYELFAVLAAVSWLGINFLLFIVLSQGSYRVYNDFSDVCPCFPYVVPCVLD